MRGNPPGWTGEPAAAAGPSAQSCCRPSIGAGAVITVSAPLARQKQDIPARFVRLPAGRAMVGTARPLLPIDGEGLLREVRVRAVAVDPFAVTNEWFAAFVAATGYVTDAERHGWSFVFHSFAPAEAGPAHTVPGTPWWMMKTRESSHDYREGSMDQLLAGRDPNEVFAKDGLLDDLKQAFSERILYAEVDEHLEDDRAEGGSRPTRSPISTSAAGPSSFSSDGQADPQDQGLPRPVRERRSHPDASAINQTPRPAATRTTTRPTTVTLNWIVKLTDGRGIDAATTVE